MSSKKAVMVMVLLGLAVAPAHAQNCNPDCGNGRFDAARFLNPPPGTTYTTTQPFAHSTHGWLRKLFYEPTDPANESPIRFASSSGNPHEATLGDIVNTDLAARHTGQAAPTGQVTIDMADVQAQADRLSDTQVTLEKR